MSFSEGKRPAQVTSCPFCRRFFPSKDSLDTHIRAHADVDTEGNYGCKVCGLPVSKSAEELNQHMISEHNFGEFSSSITVIVIMILFRRFSSDRSPYLDVFLPNGAMCIVT
ncbi:hypothetical protein BC332_34861 [Capsicum chinense]|nr:hypothetical protein BC332_34861 [Capsicum chinense]